MEMEKPEADTHVSAPEPRHTAVALALGAAGASFAFAPLGTYEFPLALGTAGLALLAPELLGQRSRVTITGATLAAAIACVLALVVALFGYLGETDLPGVDLNIEGPFSDQAEELESFIDS